MGVRCPQNVLQGLLQAGITRGRRRRTASLRTRRARPTQSPRETQVKRKGIRSPAELQYSGGATAGLVDQTVYAGFMHVFLFLVSASAVWSIPTS